MKCVYIYNPNSGNGKVLKYKDFILSSLREKFGEVEEMPTTKAGDASIYSKNACGKYDYLFVSGGDGTLNEVINGMGEAENKPIIGYIPTGTVNDVARSLKIPFSIKKAVKNILEGEPFEHDIFKVNDRYGIYVCCTGLFTSSSYATTQNVKKRLGKIAYFFKGAKDVFTARPVCVTLKTQNETISQKCALVLILNSRSTAGFLLNKNASLNDGVVEVVLIHSHDKKVKLSDIIRTANIFAFGLDRHKTSKHITYRLLKNFTMQVDDGAIINLDGEKTSSGTFDFSVINKGVKIIVPKQKKKVRNNEK